MFSLAFKGILIGEMYFFVETAAEAQPVPIPAEPVDVSTQTEHQEQTPDEPVAAEPLPEVVDPQMQASPEGKDSDFNN